MTCVASGEIFSAPAATWSNHLGPPATSFTPKRLRCPPYFRFASSIMSGRNAIWICLTLSRLRNSSTLRSSASRPSIFTKARPASVDCPGGGAVRSRTLKVAGMAGTPARGIWSVNRIIRGRREGVKTHSLFPVLRGEGWGEGQGARGVVALFDSPHRAVRQIERFINVKRRSPLSPSLSPDYRGEGVGGDAHAELPVEDCSEARAAQCG